MNRSYEGAAVRIRDWFQIAPSLRAPLAGAAVLRFSLLIAAFFLTGTAIMTQGDTASYLEPGQNLFRHGQFASGGLAELDRTPGYPIFVMLSGMLFGNVLLAGAVQIVVSLGSLLLVSRIADRVFSSSRAGVIAAWIFAVEPASIVYSSRLMPETLFVFLLLIVIERLLAFQATGKLKVLAVAGVALAAATYVRPVSYYLVFALAIGLLFTARRTSGAWWKAPTLLLVVTFPPVMLWQLRNYVETGYSGFSSIVETNLYYFQSAEVTAEIHHTTLKAEQIVLGYGDDATYAAAHPEQVSWSRAERLRYMRTQSKAILAQHFGVYLKTHFTGLGVVTFTPCASEWLQLLGKYPEKSTMPRRAINEGVLGSAMRIVRLHPGTAVVMALLEVGLLLLYGLAVLGIVAARGSRLAMLTIVCIVLYFLLISGGAQAVGRYRLPAIPEICVLAAGGVLAIQGRIRRRRIVIA